MKEVPRLVAHDIGVNNSLFQVPEGFDVLALSSKRVEDRVGVDVSTSEYILLNTFIRRKVDVGFKTFEINVLVSALSSRRDGFGKEEGTSLYISHRRRWCS